MSGCHTLHPHILVNEYEAFAHLLSKVPVLCDGQPYSFEKLCQVVSNFLVFPANREHPQIGESGVFYPIFQDKQFQISRKHLSSMNKSLVFVFKDTLANYLYSYALSSTLNRESLPKFLENAIVDVVFEDENQTPNSLNFTVGILYPYQPIERNVRVVRGDEESRT